MLEKRDFSLLQNIYTGSGVHPVPKSVGISSSFRRVKRPGREADRTIPASAKVKNSPLCLYGMQKDNHILIISLLKLKEASVAICCKVHDVLVGNAWPKVMAILMHI